MKTIERYYEAKKENNSKVLTSCMQINEYPSYSGKLRITDEDENERESIIKSGLRDFHFLIANDVIFRLCYLGQKIKEYTTDKKAIFIADLMIVNSFYYSPFYKGIYKGESIIKQL